MRATFPAIVSFALLSAAPARALVLYGGDNTATIAAPGSGVPWDAVAKVTDSSGTSISGSAVHIGNGYMITANHVSLGTHVSFDGVTTLAIDSSFGSVRLASGVDAKIFKLTSVPASFAPILETASEHTGTVALVGWGVGRNPATSINTELVGWGTDATATKRWGTNNFDSFSILAQSSWPTYNFLVTHADQGAATEAGLTRYDSGSAAFQFVGDRWYLAGLATLVTTRGGANTTTFGPTDSLGDENIFVRMSSYANQVNAITVVPEPSSWFAVAPVAAFGFLALRRRQRAKSAAIAA